MDPKNEDNGDHSDSDDQSSILSSVAPSTFSNLASKVRVANMFDDIISVDIKSAHNVLTSLISELADGLHSFVSSFIYYNPPTTAVSSAASAVVSMLKSGDSVPLSQTGDSQTENASFDFDAITASVSRLQEERRSERQEERQKERQEERQEQEIQLEHEWINEARRSMLQSPSGVPRQKVVVGADLPASNKGVKSKKLSNAVELLDPEWMEVMHKASSSMLQVGSDNWPSQFPSEVVEVADRPASNKGVKSKNPSVAVEVSNDLFDILKQDRGKLVKFAAYIGAKSEPCQVHDRTACAYADKLREYDKYADEVYEKMQKEKFITADQLKSIKTLRKSFETEFEKVCPARNGTACISQDICRNCAEAILKEYTKTGAGDGEIPQTEVVLTMPYAVYRNIKNSKWNEELRYDNDITTTLQGNDKPRMFDAASPWGDNLVNLSQGYGSGDAAVQGKDHEYNVFAFQYTECHFSAGAKGVPPRIQSMFTAVDRTGKEVKKKHIECIPLQFGHKTVECVFNPGLDNKINAATTGSIRPPPFLCTYMPQCTLDTLSNADISNGSCSSRWDDLHPYFIAGCRLRFPDASFIETDKERPDLLPQGAIPDKITHMGITWVLTAVSRGPVSLDATLNEIQLACPEVQARRDGCANKPERVVFSDMFPKFEDKTDKTRVVMKSECGKYIGFTCGGSAKERGDAGKYWDIFWTQKLLGTPCSFWSGDYLAVAATTAPGLKWGIAVNSTVTVWGIKGPRPKIHRHELHRIRDFVGGVHNKARDAGAAAAGGTIEPYDFFKSRIKMLLQYLAFIFIRDIISLIRNETPLQRSHKPLPGDGRHVALDTILILCAALGSITKSVELNLDHRGNFRPEVEINETCYAGITPVLFNKFVPVNANGIDEVFCDDNGIYDRESYFRKIIIIPNLKKALNKQSEVLWAFDYISEYTKEPSRATDLKAIYDVHTRASRKLLRSASISPTVAELARLNKTFDSVDVLCIANLIREPKPRRSPPPGYQDWLRELCTSKLKRFLVDHCRPSGTKFFCDLVEFGLPSKMGDNRLANYLKGGIFPVDIRDVRKSILGVGSAVSVSKAVPPDESHDGSQDLTGFSQEDSPPRDLNPLSSHVFPLLTGMGSAVMVSPLPLVNPHSGVQSCDFPNDNNNNNNPKRFCEDLESEYACSASEAEPDESASKARRIQQDISPPLSSLGGLTQDSRRLFGPSFSLQPRVLSFNLDKGAPWLGVGVRGGSDEEKSGSGMGGDSDENLYEKFMSFLNHHQEEHIRHLHSYVHNYYSDMISHPNGVIILDDNQAAETIIAYDGRSRDTDMQQLLISNLKRAIIEFLRKNPSQGGSSRRRLHRRRRTQYTKKHKRSSSKTTKRATIKRIKSYRKHTRTIKRRKSRRHQ